MSRSIRRMLCFGTAMICTTLGGVGVSSADERPGLAERLGLADFDPFAEQRGPSLLNGLLATTYDRHPAQGKGGGFVEPEKLENPIVGGATTMPLRFDAKRNATFTGLLLVPKTGTYAFQTISKSGNRNALYVDGKLVSAFGRGPNDPVELELTQGDHEITVVGFVESGGFVQVNWSRPDGEGFEPILPEHLRHRWPNWFEPPTIEPHFELVKRVEERFARTPKRRIPNDAASLTMAEDQRRRRAWRRSVLVDGYREFGNHDPRWDEAAETLLAQCAHGERGEDFDWPVVAAAAETVLQTGCTDPLALGFASEHFGAVRRAEDAKTVVERAIRELERSRYPAKARFFVRLKRSQYLTFTAKATDREPDPLLDLFAKAASGSLEPGENRHLLWTLDNRLAAIEPTGIDITRRLLASEDGDPWLTLVLLARQHRSVAWVYRRIGRRDDFSWHMAAAKARALAAWHLQPTAPEAATILVELWDEDDNSGVTNESARFWFDEAVAACMDHQPAYDEYLEVLRDNRFETFEEFHAFGRECVATERFDTAVPAVLLRCTQRYAQGNPGFVRAFERVDLFEDLETAFAGYSRVELDHIDELNYMSHLFALTAVLKSPADVRQLAGLWGGMYNLEILRAYGVDFARTWNDVFAPRRFLGHDDRVWSLAASPDGSRLFSLGSDLKVWDRKTGRLLHELDVHRAGAVDVGFSPDGRRFATCSTNGTAIVWDAETFRPIHHLEHDYEVQGVEFSPDGKWLVAGQGRTNTRERGAVTIWNAETGEKVKELPDQRYGGMSVAFSPDGKRLAASDSVRATYAEGHVKLWSTADWSLEKTIQPIKGIVFELDFVDDETLSVLGVSLEGTTPTHGTRIVDVGTGEVQRIVNDKDTYVELHAVSPDGRLLANSASQRYRSEGLSDTGVIGGISVFVYDPATGERLAALRGFTTPIGALQFSPDGRFLFVAERSGVLHEFRMDDPPRGLLHGNLRPFKHPGGVQVDYSPDGRLLATTGGRFVHVWDARTNEGLFVMAAAAELIEHVEFSPDSRRIATVGGRVGSGKDDKRLQVWDVETGRLLWGHPSRGNHQWSVAFSPDGKRLATGHRTGSILVHDAETGRIVARVQAGKDGGGKVRTLAFHPDGKTLVAGNARGEIVLWRIPEPNEEETPLLEELARWKGHEHLVYRVAFSPDGSRIGSGDSQGNAVVWDAVTRKAVHRVVGNEILFSRDGRRFAASGRAVRDDLRPESYRVRVHDVETGAILVTTVKRHQRPVVSADWSPDGKRIVTGGGDFVGVVWNAETGQQDWSMVEPAEKGETK